MKTLLTLTVFVFLFLSFTLPVDARQGCCSWHGGVSHCDTSVGRYVCNDGTYSPSCGCAYIPAVVKVSPTPTRRPTIPPTATPIPTQAVAPVVESASEENSSDGVIAGLVSVGALFGFAYGVLWVKDRIVGFFRKNQQ